MDESEFYDTVDSDALFDPVEPDIRQWPIYIQGKNRKKLIESVGEEAVDSLLEDNGQNGSLAELIASTYQQEKRRIKEVPWKADPRDDNEYWRKVRKNLVKNTDPTVEPEDARKANAELLTNIVGRYAEEIAGNFRIRTFRFAKRATNFGFTRLFSAAKEGFMKGLWNPKRRLREKIILTGEMESIRELSQKGVLLLVPTHFSNLDSIVLGWAIEAIGLPAVTYGAGINLYGHPILAYFMSRLGAYKVDRRKKNDIYLTTLKTYSTQILANGSHMLFFPGGTRSRSGGIEKSLKLGLLGTAIEAQRRLVEGNEEQPKKIFVVPIVTSYHVVLEGRNLIDSYLKRTDGDRAVMLEDDFFSVWKNLKFIWKFLRSGSEMMFRFGQPMDLFGNPVEASGESLDSNGKQINITDYFRVDGKVASDKQRDEVYTEILGDHILKQYYRENIVFSSHVVAYTAFELFRSRYKKLDLFEFLRMPEDDMVITARDFELAVEKVMDQLLALRTEEKIRLAPHLDSTTQEIIEHGISNLGIYHIQQPLKVEKDSSITTGNIKLLFYYRNRLDGYGLNVS